MKSAESARGELQSQVLQLEDTVERQQRFISRLEEERDRCRKSSKRCKKESRYMGEGAEQAQRIDCLLEEGRNAETILQHTKKQVAWFSDDSYSKRKTPGGRRQSRAEEAAESLSQVEGRPRLTIIPIENKIETKLTTL